MTIALVVVGGFVGFLIALVSAFQVPTGDGLMSAGVLGTLLIGPYAHLLGRTLRSSAAAALPCVVWLVTTMALASTRAEGDLIVTGSAEGVAFLLGGTLASAVGIGTVRSGVARSDRRAAERAAARAAAEAAAAEAAD